VTAAESNLGDRVLGEVEKNTGGLFLCQTKGDTAGSYLPKLYFPAWEDKMMNFIAMFQG